MLRRGVLPPHPPAAFGGDVRRAQTSASLVESSSRSRRRFLPRCGGEGEKNIYLYLLGGFAAQKIQNNLIPRPWGRGVDVSSAERLGVGETLRA